MGIPNYRYFSGRLDEEVARSNRYQVPLSLIVVESRCDRFRTINDTFGHGVGDLVLIALAKLVLSVARDSDITTRYGRDQVAIIATSSAIMPTNRNLLMKPKSRLVVVAIPPITKKMSPVPAAA